MQGVEGEPREAPVSGRIIARVNGDGAAGWLVIILPVERFERERVCMVEARAVHPRCTL